MLLFIALLEFFLPAKADWKLFYGCFPMPFLEDVVWVTFHYVSTVFTASTWCQETYFETVAMLLLQDVV